MNKRLQYALNLQLFAEGGEGEVDPQPTVSTIDKATYDKLASEYASLKKQMRASLTAEDQHKAELADRDEEIRLLKREVQVSKIRTGLSDGGISGDKVASIINAYTEHDDETFIRELSSYVGEIREGHKREVDQLRLDTTPRPGAGSNTGGDDTVTKKDFLAMTYMEQLEFKQKHPELYKKYTR